MVAFDIPSSSLASVYGLLAECTGRRFSATTSISKSRRWTSAIPSSTSRRRFAASVTPAADFVGLVGVQSNQYPRALDLARIFRKQGIAVAISSFHVSGVISMLPEMTPELKEAVELGVVLYAGESEGRMTEFLRDMAKWEDQADLQSSEGFARHERGGLPMLPREVVTRVAGSLRKFRCRPQLSLSNAASAPSSTVQGRKSRCSADDVEGIVRANAKQNICPSSSPTTITHATRTGSRSSIA